MIKNRLDVIYERYSEIEKDYNQELGTIRTENFTVKLEPGEGVVQDSFFIRKGCIHVHCFVEYSDLKDYLIETIEI